MKRTIALLLACLLISCAAGCGKSDSGSSSKTESATKASEPADSVSDKPETSADDTSGSGTVSKTESDAGSKAESKPASKAESKPASVSGTESVPDNQNDDGDEDEGSEEVVEATFDEEGNLVFDIGDPDEWEEDESGEDVFFDDIENDGSVPERDDFISSYSIQMLSPKDFKSKGPFPAHYVITSESDLKGFIDSHSSDYALNVEYTGDDFIEKSSFIGNAANNIKKDLDDFDYILIIAEHSNSEELDVGSGSIQGNSAVVDIWAAKPSTAANKAYSCLVIPVDKGFLNGKELTVKVGDPPVEDDEQ